MASSIRKAVILAAGRGTRMQSLTDDCPKPMLPLDGKPMLAHQIERLESVGVDQVCAIVGYKAEMVKDYFTANRPARATVSYELQETQDGTGSAARLAREFVGNDDFLLTFGDILVDPNVYPSMFDLAHGAEVVLTVKHVDDPYQGAAVYVKGDRVSKVIEKPPKGTSTTHFNNAGIYVFSAGIFDRLDGLEPSPRGEYELTDAVHGAVEEGEVVRWLEIKGFWKDVGRPEDLAPAGNFVSQ